jgi:hypothetical protein
MAIVTSQPSQQCTVFFLYLVELELKGAKLVTSKSGASDRPGVSIKHAMLTASITGRLLPPTQQQL